MNYIEFKQKQETELNNFPMAFAFSQKQLDKAMQKLNVTKHDEIVSIGGGGIVRKTDVQKLKTLFAKHHQERELFFTDDANLLDSLIYELGNHEYCITGDVQDTLDALGLPSGDRVNRIICEAIKTYNAQVECY